MKAYQVYTSIYKLYICSFNIIKIKWITQKKWCQEKALMLCKKAILHVRKNSRSEKHVYFKISYVNENYVKSIIYK